MPHNSDQPDAHKRKRNADEGGGQVQPPPPAERIPQPPPPQSGNAPPINYLARASPSKLSLIQGDEEVFSDVICLLGEYEGVLARHESLAANLGAKLTGPRLVKAMESAFDGPISVSPADPFAPNPVTWLDIVHFAKANPGDFNLTVTADHARVCQFFLKGAHVEITEDDWRLIMSGALDRYQLLPPHQLEEDESAEMATLDILEQRLQVLIMKADEVARKARQLNYKLSGRKAGINARRSSTQSAPSGSGFQPASQPPPRPQGGTPAYDLHSDLLQQFLGPLSQPGSMRMLNSVSLPNTPVVHQTPPQPLAPSNVPQRRASQQFIIQTTRPSPGGGPPTFVSETSPRDQGSADDSTAPYRLLVTARIEKLNRGDSIQPPCDRCRRLKLPCIKHLTACQGCTKKHAKCAWKSVTDDEATALRMDMGFPALEPGGSKEGERDGPSPSGVGYAPNLEQGQGQNQGPAREVRAQSETSTGRRTSDSRSMPAIGGGGTAAEDMDVDLEEQHGRGKEVVRRAGAAPPSREDPRGKSYVSGFVAPVADMAPMASMAHEARSPKNVSSSRRGNAG